jgi:hypothetical protein
MIGLAATLALAGCGSAPKAAPAAATAKTPKASAQAAAARQPSVDAGIEVYGNCKTPSVEPAEIVLAAVQLVQCRDSSSAL